MIDRLLLYICLIIFVVIILMLLLVYRGNRFDWLKNKKEIFVYFVFISFIVIVILLIAKMETGSALLNDNLDLPINETQKVRDITLNKVIIVGDSRMEFIIDNKSKLNIPTNFLFQAQSGTGVEWLRDTEANRLRDTLESRNKKYHYHVVFNMGVNDLQSKEKVKNKTFEYIKIYKKIVEKYNDVSFYILSVNPIDEGKINKFIKENIRTNSKIEEMNDYFLEFTNDESLDNLTYCDSYDNIKFGSPDGLHYDLETDQKIIDYIVNDCIDYE